MKKKFKVRQFNFELRGANVTRKVGSQSVYGYYVLKQRKKRSSFENSFLLIKLFASMWKNVDTTCKLSSNAEIPLSRPLLGNFSRPGYFYHL